MLHSGMVPKMPSLWFLFLYSFTNYLDIEKPWKDTMFLEDSQATKWKETCVSGITFWVIYYCVVRYSSTKWLKSAIIYYVSYFCWSPWQSLALCDVNWRIGMAEHSTMSSSLAGNWSWLPARTPGGLQALRSVLHMSLCVWCWLPHNTSVWVQRRSISNGSDRGCRTLMALSTSFIS